MSPDEPDTDATTDADRGGDSGGDVDLGVPRAVEAAVRGRLTALAAGAVAPGDAWAKLTARTASARRARSLWGRGRLLAAAAVLLLMVGSTVTDAPEAGRDRVETAGSSGIPDDSFDRENRFDRDRETGDGDGENAGYGDEPGDDEAAWDDGAWDEYGWDDADLSDLGDDWTSRSASDDDGSGGGPVVVTVPGGGGTSTTDPSTPTTRPSTSTTRPTTTTTTTPPARLPGDVTVTTSSGFAVEVLVDGDGADHLAFWLRRTDSAYDPSAPPSFPPDRYVPLTIVFAGTSYTETPAGSGNYVAHEPRGRQCVSYFRWAHAATAPHELVYGLVGADIARVRVHTTEGRVVEATPSPRIVGDFHAYLVETVGPVELVEGFDASGELLTTAVDGPEPGEGAEVRCRVDVPGREPPPP
jgi:hypothetical protein